MILFQPVLVRNLYEADEGRLAFVDGTLVAILVRLSGDEVAELRGHWFVEAGFGPCEVRQQTTFANLNEAREWIADRMNVRPNLAIRGVAG